MMGSGPTRKSKRMEMKTNNAVVILAAGQGTRMRSAKTKVLHEIGGLAMLGHVMNAANALSAPRMAVVIGDHAPETGEYAASRDAEIGVYTQSPPRGTADAVMQALPIIDDFEGAVLVLYADTPLITPAILKQLAECVHGGASVAVLGFTPDEPGGYGRLKTDQDGRLIAIVEAKDASDEELAIRRCNSGVMAIDAAFLRRRLGDIGNDNAKKEFYLTDIVGLAREEGLNCVTVDADNDEVIGVNSRSELAEAERIFQERYRRRAMEAGVTLLDPATVYFSFDTQIGKDVVVEPGVFFGPGVSIGERAVIKAFSHIEQAAIGADASVGPFARLRPGARVGEDAKVGNFVEIKKATLGPGAKVSHLTYIGDADIGAGANIGAGTITCNYDGYSKHRTVIGEGAFIGSNTALVAPVNIGDGAFIGSGSVITKDVEAGDLAVARGRQAAIKGWAARFRATHEGEGA